MSLLTIRLAYDRFHLFAFFLLNMEVKKAKLNLNFIIYLAHDYKDRSLSKLSRIELNFYSSKAKDNYGSN